VVVPLDMKPILNHRLPADQSQYLRLPGVGIHLDMGEVLVLGWKDGAVPEVQLLDTFVPVGMTSLLDHKSLLDQARHFPLLDVVGPHNVILILDHSRPAVQPLYSQLPDVAVLIVSLILDRNLSALDTSAAEAAEAVEAAKVHYTVPVGQADMTLASIPDPSALDTGEVELPLIAAAQLVDVVQDIAVQEVVTSLPALFLVPIHIDVAPVAGCSGMPHKVVGLVEVSQEDSWLAIVRAHLRQARACGVSSAGLVEN
jgi:hypothetical protein